MVPFSEEKKFRKPNQALPAGKQACPKCGFPIGVIAGSKEAICKNCGFKDPCCE